MAKKAKESKPTNVDPDKVAGCYAEYASLRADGARLNQKIAAMFGRYDKEGVDQKSIKNAYALSSKDPAEAARQHRRNTEYLHMLDIISVDAEGQTGFADGIAPTAAQKPSADMVQTVLLARIYNDGYNSGLAGGKIDACGHKPGGEAFVRWRDGWQDGHADRVAKNPDADKVTQAEPRKRGRPRKNATDGIGDPAGNA